MITPILCLVTFTSCSVMLASMIHDHTVIKKLRHLIDEECEDMRDRLDDTFFKLEDTGKQLRQQQAISQSLNQQLLAEQQAHHETMQKLEVANDPRFAKFVPRKVRVAKNKKPVTINEAAHGHE